MKGEKRSPINKVFPGGATSKKKARILVCESLGHKTTRAVQRSPERQKGTQALTKKCLLGSRLWPDNLQKSRGSALTAGGGKTVFVS